MLGIIVGTAALIGLIKVLRGGRRWGHGYGHGRCGSTGGGAGCDEGGGCGGGGFRRHHHGFGGWRGGWRGGRDWGGEDDDAGPGPVLLRGLFERLSTTPGQEKVIAEALKDLRAAFKKSAEEKAKGAKEVAEALRSDDFKTENMGEAFAHLEEGTNAVRDATFSALAKIHEALDERQRKILADIVGRGGRALENLAEQA